MNSSIERWRRLSAVFFLMASTAAQSSMIVAPHGPGRDSDLAGNVVAAPDDGSSALLTNPAGVVSRAKHETMIAIVPGTLEVRYQNPATGYDGSGSKDLVSLGFWHGLGEVDGWSMGVGAYGSLGAAFTLPAAPAIGQTSPYLGEMGIMNFGINAGKQLTSHLRFGLQLAPQFGMQKMRMPSPLGDIHLKANGVGLSASAGLVYALTDEVSLGLAYRTPGVTKFEGDARVGNVGQDVSVKLVSPQSLTAGLAWQPVSQLRLLGQAAWTRFEDFERGEVEFEKTTLLNGPIISRANNRVRWGVALEYEFVRHHVFRTGFSQGKAMIADEAVNPTFYDHDNDMVMAGYEADFGDWRLGFTAGYASNKSRRVSAADNPNFPGVYKSQSPASVGVRVTYLHPSK